MRALAVFGLAWSLSLAAYAQDAAACELSTSPAPHVRVTEGVAYANTGGATRRFDIARPADERVRPAVVLIHGGGWAAGSRDLTHRAMYALAARGYVAVAIDYRLARSARTQFPGAVSDVRCAVRRLRADAARHRIDPERIAAVGFSAGGHLAAMLALGSDVQGLDDGSCPVEGDARVRGAVAWYAPFDLRTAERPRWAQVVGDFLGAHPSEAPDRAALASPILHASHGDAPLFIVHGTEDAIVDIDEARSMLAALRAARVPGDMLEVEGGRHGFPFGSARHRAAACTTIAAIDGWLRD
jgi:acetyl esterase/lipase